MDSAPGLLTALYVLAFVLIASEAVHVTPNQYYKTNKRQPRQKQISLSSGLASGPWPTLFSR